MIATRDEVLRFAQDDTKLGSQFACVLDGCEARHLESVACCLLERGIRTDEDRSNKTNNG